MKTEPYHRVAANFTFSGCYIGPIHLVLLDANLVMKLNY